MALNPGIQHLVETDSTAVSDLINNERPISHPLFSIIHDCRSTMTSFVGIRLSHAYREANFCANSLAKHGESMDFLVDGGNTYQASLLENDAQRAKTPRLVCTSVS